MMTVTNTSDYPLILTAIHANYVLYIPPGESREIDTREGFKAKLDGPDGILATLSLIEAP